MSIVNNYINEDNNIIAMDSRNKNINDTNFDEETLVSNGTLSTNERKNPRTYIDINNIQCCKSTHKFDNRQYYYVMNSVKFF